jgi:hypothetical protein
LQVVEDDDDVCEGASGGTCVAPHADKTSERRAARPKLRGFRVMVVVYGRRRSEFHRTVRPLHEQSSSAMTLDGRGRSK